MTLLLLTTKLTSTKQLFFQEYQEYILPGITAWIRHRSALLRNVNQVFIAFKSIDTYLIYEIDSIKPVLKRFKAVSNNIPCVFLCFLQEEKLLYYRTQNSAEVTVFPI